jgi:hypothetical protein
VWSADDECGGYTDANVSGSGAGEYHA